MAAPPVSANAGGFQPLRRPSRTGGDRGRSALAIEPATPGRRVSQPRLAAGDAGHRCRLRRPGLQRFGPLEHRGQARACPAAADRTVGRRVGSRKSRRSKASWVAAPLVRHATSGELLLVARRAVAPSADSLRSIEALAAVLASALDTVRRAQHEHARIGRLEAILEIASQWNKTSEMEPLLKQMAEAATRLLAADRASIFLWDRPNHTLVGRPALGVESGRAAHSRQLGRRRPGGPHRPGPPGQHS